MRKNLYIASKNNGKINEYRKLLAGINCNLMLQPDWIEIIEDGKNFRDNALKKASRVSSETKNYAIADDSGLCVNALEGRPGIYSSRYAKTDCKRIERLISELEGFDNRSAFFVANICVCSPEGELILDVEDRCNGNILYKPRGSNGFGYDPIFEEISTGLTFAEMNDHMKDKYSHRGRATKKIIPQLLSLFN